VIFPTQDQTDALEQVSRGFREYSRSQNSLAVAMGVVLAFGLVAVLLYAVVSGRERFLGRRMFYRLARASGLARAEARFLVAVSRRVLPDNPPAIFVRRSLFESAVSTMSADAALVQSVRKKVYGA
jgi:hypothetical protein